MTSSEISQIIRDAIGGALQPARAELQKELAAATKERDALAQPRTTKTRGELAALDVRRAEANRNVARLQSAVDKLNASTTADQWRTSTSPPPFDNGFPPRMIIPVMGILFVAFPFAIAFSRIIWKRASHVPAPSSAQLPAESTRRFDQLEHAVDAIALEVERISENQRYLTKLLSEPRPNAAVGAGRSGPPQS